MYSVYKEWFPLIILDGRTLIIYEEIFLPNDFPPGPFRIYLFHSSVGKFILLKTDSWTLRPRDGGNSGFVPQVGLIRN